MAVKDAIRLLGNASAQISKLRRKKVLKKMNPDIQDLANEDIFQEAAPDLFGSEFEKRMRKRAKSLQVLDDVKPSPQPTTSKFFRGGRPTVPQRGGGPFNRGGDDRLGQRRTRARRSNSPSGMHTTNSNSKELSECDSKCSVSKGGNSKGFLRGETPFRIHSWKINTFQQQLGKGHPRSVGVTGFCRLLDQTISC